MAFETMLIKVKTAIFASQPEPNNNNNNNKKTKTKTKKKKEVVGVLGFEMAGVMSKLVQLWRSLSDKTSVSGGNIDDGVRKIVSNDDAFLLSLACAETLHAVRLLADPVSRAAARAAGDDSFPALLRDFADTGRDPRGWALPWREMDALARRMERLASATAGLRRGLELSLHQKAAAWRREEEVKYLKERSLWGRSFESAASVLARALFTVLARAKLVFGLPSDDARLLEERTRLLREPPRTTLGAAGLAVHYAGVVIVIEKFIKSPHLVGPEARDELYAMLPLSVRSALRARLRGVGFSATDPGLAAEWRSALARILAWLSPLAHNMVRWQNDRSLEQHHHGGSGVMLLQTLYFANTEKAEAAITELLVGLNYIWRFEREMTAMAFFQSHSNINNNNNALLIDNSVVVVVPVN